MFIFELVPFNLTITITSAGESALNRIAISCLQTIFGLLVFTAAIAIAGETQVSGDVYPHYSISGTEAYNLDQVKTDRKSVV